uniref:Uncharacterized protein n=1 Tax=Arundo donax TaxID=35708 RepID=A0A0A9BCC1_ARUDO
MCSELVCSQVEGDVFLPPLLSVECWLPNSAWLRPRSTSIRTVKFGAFSTGINWQASERAPGGCHALVFAPSAMAAWQ